MTLLIRDIDREENKFTKAFFEDFLGETTAGTRDNILSFITDLANESVRRANVEAHPPPLKGGSMPDVKIQLEDGTVVFIEVKVRPEAYSPGQVARHVKEIAVDFASAFYVFIDKSRVGFPALRLEFANAEAGSPTVIKRHKNWFDVYESLLERRRKFDYEHRDYLLIGKILSEMEELGMKPFKRYDNEAIEYLRQVREKKLRDFSQEVDGAAIRILDEVEYLLYMKYDRQGFELALDKTELKVESFSPAIGGSLKPRVYSDWDKEEKRFDVFVGLFIDEEKGKGHVFPHELFLPLALLFKGNGIVLEMDSEEGKGWHTSPLDDWLEEADELPEGNTVLWVGYYLNPEEYEGRGIVEDIFGKLCLFIDKLTPFLEEQVTEKKRKQR